MLEIYAITLSMTFDFTILYPFPPGSVLDPDFELDRVAGRVGDGLAYLLCKCFSSEFGSESILIHSLNLRS